ncbi:MAG TPA: bacteriohopanetetrol glucosamine biosynthesis glycosyltransferase HpnI [Candidatus Binatia bacterium]|nr:bacteriohopanetetrol glucosamine biosynthesis glycosyltransferase HpnI [Candidatus Binatia bacterium]
MISLIFYFLLAVAVIGTVSSTVFLGMVLAAVLHFRADVRDQLRSAPDAADLPPVSILKPVHGLEAQLKENIESFFRQDYPRYEILFAADEPNDAALDVVREVSARYPHIPSRILVTGTPWPNPVVYSFHSMAQEAAHDILVTTDSDVEVDPDYLRQVVAPLLDPKVGMLTCLYRGKNAAGFWSGLTAVGMSVEMPAGVLVANLLEGMKFGLGPTTVVRKDALASIGGYTALRDYIAYDFAIGNLIERAGYRVALSGHVINHVVNQKSFRKMWQNQLRWAQTTRYSRPKGHFGSGLVFAMPYGLLGLIAAAGLGHWGLGVAFFATALLNRLIEAWIVGWETVRDPVIRRAPWLYPLRDLLGFAVWFASYLNLRYEWRDSRFELKGTKIALRQQQQPQSRSDGIP